MKKLSQFKDGLNFFNGIEFNLKRKNIKNLIIKISSKNTIDVSIPLKANDEMIEKFLSINIDKFKNYVDKKKENISVNEKEKWFYIFGEKTYFDLDVKNNKIIINDKKYSINKKSISEVINTWRKKQLQIYLLINQLHYQKIMNIDSHIVKVRDKTTAWATNHINKKIIYYSTNLSSFSKEIIDYVIVHELAHNKYANHSKEFWKFVEKYDSDYRKKRLKLKKLIYSFF